MGMWNTWEETELLIYAIQEPFHTHKYLSNSQLNFTSKLYTCKYKLCNYYSSHTQSQALHPSQVNTLKLHLPAKQVTNALPWIFKFLSPEPSANDYTYLLNVLQQRAR